eukprot:m.25843 g.25843  ORF g.25843 m.25843 type:complete len:136 (+) comp11633_c0_seq1:72-479(+)
MAAENHYTVLQCSPNASVEQLRANYRALSKQHHPDKKHGDGATFAALAEAWRTLSDVSSRALYDAQLQVNGREQQLPYHDTIFLSDMEVDEEVYFYDCRCGGEYTLELATVTTQQDQVVPCDGCTLAIRVQLQPP